MRSIAPRTGAPEDTIAEEQEEYRPLTIAHYQMDGKAVALTRWTFTPEERARVAAGEDVYIAELTFGRPFTPIIVQCGPEGFTV